MTKTPLWNELAPGRRTFKRLPVTETLAGELALPVHVLTGAKPGPTLGMTATIHGDESLPAMIMRQLLDEMESEDLSGRIVVMPVCNPRALAAFGRQTPEQHGKTDLHEVFPGNPRGNLTQMLAAAIARNLVEHVDILVDYHCGGSGGRLQERVDIHRGTTGPIRERSLELARSFGAVMVHDNELGGSAVAYANSLGKPAFNIETAGVYLGPEATTYYVEKAMSGFKNILRTAGMLDGEVAKPPRQLLFTPAERKEANPSRGGHLESYFQQPSDLGKPVRAGEKLGELIDMYTLEAVEELTAPVEGYLFFSRYSGAIDAGTKAFAIASLEGAKWLD